MSVLNFLAKPFLLRSSLHLCHSDAATGSRMDTAKHLAVSLHQGLRCRGWQLPPCAACLENQQQLLHEVLCMGMTYLMQNRTKA